MKQLIGKFNYMSPISSFDVKNCFLIILKLGMLPECITKKVDQKMWQSYFPKKTHGVTWNFSFFIFVLHSPADQI